MERERARHFFSSGVSNNPRHMSTGERRTAASERKEKRSSQSVIQPLEGSEKNKLMRLNQFPLHKERRNISLSLRPKRKSNRCSRCWANVTVADYLSLPPVFFLPGDGEGRDIPLRRTKVPRYPPPRPSFPLSLSHSHYLPKREEEGGQMR